MGKSIYEVFETCLETENNGQWFNYGLNPDGTKLRYRLASMTKANKKYAASYQKMYDEYGAQMDAGTLDEQTAHDAMLHIFSTTVLVDWDNSQDREGNTVPWSAEAVTALMNELPKLYENLQKRASAHEHYLKVQKEADAGN